VDQVKRYLASLAKEDRHQLTRLAGIAFDGQYIVFVRYYAPASPLTGSISSSFAITPESFK